MSSTAGITPPTRRGRSVRMIGEVAVDLGFAAAADVDAAVDAARAEGRPTGTLLVERGVITPAQLARVVAERFGLDHVDLEVFRPDVGAVNLIGADAARRYRAMPIAFGPDGTLIVAMSDPGNVVAIDDIALLTSRDVVPAIADPAALDALINRLNRLDEVVMEAADDVLDDAEVAPDADRDDTAQAGDAPVVRLVQGVLAEAVRRGASDIHFEPSGGELDVRFRIDGVLVDSTIVPRALAAGAISRLKLMAELDISERRIPQDGRVGIAIDGRRVDLRVASLPVVGGESLVIRILDQSEGQLGLEGLGMSDHDRTALERELHRAHGAILVTGPTGSGKTTTLYAALEELNSRERSIVTIEDPVEYRVEGIKQMQVSPRAGLTFATGLRSIVRSDPDIVMVGEIRDRETAQIAIESALTGHLVLSTLHTNDAPGAVTRLIEMGVPPFLVASSVRCVVAQRLVRVLCEHCRIPSVLTVEMLADAGFESDGPLDAYEPGGCVHCDSTGYHGRTGIYELITVDATIRELILAREDADAIGDAAEAAGTTRLRADGFEKVRTGITSLAELLRVAGI